MVPISIFHLKIHPILMANNTKFAPILDLEKANKLNGIAR